MSDEQRDGGPAFARAGSWGEDQPDFDATSQVGMSLRDYFAAHALQGLIASYTNGDRGLPPNGYAATVAYGFADAMLAERQKDSRT